MNIKPMICVTSLISLFLASNVHKAGEIFNPYSTSRPEKYKAELKRPSDWNRDFWITQRLDNLSFDGYEYNYKEYIEPAKNYPANFYEVCDEQNQKHVHGMQYTRYIIMDNEGDILVHSIRITDPTVTLYGLTLSSSKEEIKKNLMMQPSFRVRETVMDSNLKVCASYLDAITFFFFEDAICIEMEVPSED